MVLVYMVEDKELTSSLLQAGTVIGRLVLYCISIVESMCNCPKNAYVLKSLDENVVFITDGVSRMW